MRARKIIAWALLAAVTAYLFLMAEGPIRLVEPATRSYIGSAAAVAIGLAAVAFVALFLVNRNRRRS